MQEVATEHVLVVPTELFHGIGHFQGFCSEVDRYLAELLRAEHASYRPRAEMENDPSFKQLIPYTIFRHVDSAGRDTVFCYTRGTGQGEGRLHSKRSIGVGGHISSVDAEASSIDPYNEGRRREVSEEVEVETPFVERCVGLINDDESPVGQVHLGIVHLVDVERPAVKPREADIVDAGFVTVNELLADLGRFETWSQICLEALFCHETCSRQILD